MTMNILPLACGLTCGLIALFTLFRPFFGDKRDFLECIEYTLKPNFLSWLDKDLQRDYGKSTKLSIYLIIGIGSGYLAYVFVDKLMSGN
jgi:hypothetical protein